MLANKTVFGILWSFLDQLLRKGTSVLVTLLLAYFLTPEDYGLIAMMSLFIALGGVLVDSGFKQALIRKVDLNSLDISTAFYTNILLALCAYLLVYLCAPLIAGYYNEISLVDLIRVASLVFLINSFQIVQIALLSKKLKFKALLKANLPASIISGIIAITLANLGFGVWSLVMQMVFSSLLITIFLWLQSCWRPSLVFSLSSLKDMYSFGYKLFLASLIDAAFKNVFVVIIAKVFSVTVAGLYFFADRIKELLVSHLIASIQGVTFPALAEIQNDSKRLKQAYKKIMRVMTFTVFPILLLFSVVAELLFKLFLGDKWLQAVPYLQLMCISCMVIPIISINLNIIKVKGFSGWYLLLEIVKKVTGLIILFFTHSYGVLAILTGQMLSLILNYPPSVYLSSKLVDYSLFEQLKDFLPNLFLAAFMACITHYFLEITYLPDIISLIIALFIFLAGYILIAFTFNFKAFTDFMQMFKRLK